MDGPPSIPSSRRRAGHVAGYAATAVVALAVGVAVGARAPGRRAAAPVAAAAERAGPAAWASRGVRFVRVAPDVRLEVIDWGGTGRPVVLLAGLGATAHDLEPFARQLRDTYHVYGITRRGFGASDAPVSGYTADRLGDDVLAVLDSLALDRPVLLGHSIGGQELSSIGSRHPERVAGLVYLDAGYEYAYYDRTRPSLGQEVPGLRRRLTELEAAVDDRPDEARRVLRELRETDLPAFGRALQSFDAALRSTPPGPRPRALSAAAQAILAGVQPYADIRAPVLALYAYPHRVPPALARDPAGQAAFRAADSGTAIQAAAFARGVPSARVVRLANADHWIFVSHEADVLREVRTFIATLPPAGAK